MSIWTGKEKIHLMGGPGDGKVIEASIDCNKISIPYLATQSCGHLGAMVIGHHPMIGTARYHRLAESNIYYYEAQDAK